MSLQIADEQEPRHQETQQSTQAHKNKWTYMMMNHNRRSNLINQV